MRRITMLFTFALLASACDEPDQAAHERVYVEVSADNADILSEDGELIRSLAPEELSIVLEGGEQVSIGSPDDLIVAPEDPEQVGMRCFVCGPLFPIGGGYYGAICKEVACQAQ